MMDSKIKHHYGIATALAIVFWTIPGCMDGSGDAANGALLFAQGDGINLNGGCQSCHCPNAAGGCRLDAPNIQGQSFAVLNARTRDPNVEHPGGKYDFTEQDLSDIEAFLATLVNGM